MFDDFLSSFDLGDYGNWIGPALGAGATIYGSMAQADQMKDMAKKQSRSYQDYLSAINPPEAVKETRFNEMKDQVLSAAPVARRRLEDRLASRGIRGGGTAAPMGNQESEINKALNDAYFKVYGQHNVPGSPGPASATPSSGQLLGMNAGQVGAYMLPSMLNKAMKTLKPGDMTLNWGGDENDGSDYWNWMMDHPAGR